MKDDEGQSARTPFRFEHPVIPLIIVGIIAVALLVWIIAEWEIGWTG